MHFQARGYTYNCLSVTVSVSTMVKSSPRHHDDSIFQAGFRVTFTFNLPEIVRFDGPVRGPAPVSLDSGEDPCPACSVPKNVNVFLLVFNRVVNVAHVHVHCVHHLFPGQHGRVCVHVYGIPSKGPKTAMRRLVAHAGGAKHASLDGPREKGL